MLLYHVTPIGNEQSIRVRGVDPAYSQGARELSWWVQKGNIQWALAHVSAKKGIPVSEMMVVVGYIPRAYRRRTRWEGVFQCAEVVKPIECKRAEEYVDGPGV